MFDDRYQEILTTYLFVKKMAINKMPVINSIVNEMLIKKVGLV